MCASKVTTDAHVLTVVAGQRKVDLDLLLPCGSDTSAHDRLPACSIVGSEGITMAGTLRDGVQAALRTQMLHPKDLQVRSALSLPARLANQCAGAGRRHKTNVSKATIDNRHFRMTWQDVEV